MFYADLIGVQEFWPEVLSLEFVHLECIESTGFETAGHTGIKQQVIPRAPVQGCPRRPLLVGQGFRARTGLHRAGRRHVRPGHAHEYRTLGNVGQADRLEPAQRSVLQRPPWNPVPDVVGVVSGFQPKPKRLGDSPFQAAVDAGVVGIAGCAGRESAASLRCGQEEWRAGKR